MTRHIVVPLDGSARDAEALDVARNLARHLEAGLLLVHIEPILPPLADVVASDHQLAQYAAALAAEGFDVRYLVNFGRPVANIAAAAQQQELIILTPRHRGLLDALRRPSVTKGLLSRAPVPLFILPEAIEPQHASALLADPDALVIVPLDGSELAEQALPRAVAVARAYARALLLVRVVPTVFVPSVGPETMRIRHQAQLEEEIEARDYLAATRERLREESGQEAQTLRLHGEAAECLTRLTNQHPNSLLVMSTRGRGGFARAVLGSVASEVVRRSVVPLVIVPPASSSSDPLQPDGRPHGIPDQA